MLMPSLFTHPPTYSSRLILATELQLGKLTNEYNFFHLYRNLYELRFVLLIKTESLNAYIMQATIIINIASRTTLVIFSNRAV